MKKPKQFDCVQMKWDIQQRLLSEFDRLSPEEARRANNNGSRQTRSWGRSSRDLPPLPPRCRRTGRKSDPSTKRPPSLKIPV